MLTPLLALAAMLVAPTAEDQAKLDAKAERLGEFSSRLVAYWDGREGTGKPTLDIPTKFNVTDTYKDPITPEQRQLMGRRIRAMIDALFAHPAMQDSGIKATLIEPNLSRNGAERRLGTTLHFRLKRGFEESELNVTLHFTKLFSRTVGKTAGGCQRYQMTNLGMRGREVLYIDRPGPVPVSAVPQIGISVPEIPFVGEKPMRNEDSLDGRIVAMAYSIDCHKLLDLANTP